MILQTVKKKIVCFTLLQGKSPLSSVNTYPEVDFMPGGHPTKSESEYPTTRRSSLLEKLTLDL